jgi:hypothetical protein
MGLNLVKHLAGGSKNSFGRIVRHSEQPKQFRIIRIRHNDRLRVEMLGD